MSWGFCRFDSRVPLLFLAVMFVIISEIAKGVLLYGRSDWRQMEVYRGGLGARLWQLKMVWLAVWELKYCKDRGVLSAGFTPHRLSWDCAR